MDRKSATIILLSILSIFLFFSLLIFFLYYDENKNTEIKSCQGFYKMTAFTKRDTQDICTYSFPMELADYYVYNGRIYKLIWVNEHEFKLKSYNRVYMETKEELNILENEAKGEVKCEWRDQK